MNGTIDLSSSSQDFSSNGMGNVLQYEDDDSSWSETSDSCSCSSCGTCYMCDICNDTEFCANVGHCNEKPYAKREFTTKESIKLPLPSLQKDQHSLRSIKSKDPYETRKDLLCTSKGSNKNKHTNSISVMNCKTSSNSQDPIQISEPNYVTYSSGSDKEINSSVSSSVSSSILKNADSSSEISSNENFTGLPLNTEKREKVAKKVTFSETCSRGKQFRPFKDSSSNIMQSPVAVPRQSCHNTEVSSECIRLQSVLKNIDPFFLRSFLLDQLKKQDARTIQTLGKLFPKKRYPLATIHCVRCHNEYNPFPGKGRCKLKHPIDALARISQSEQLACYSCGVCKKEYWVNILEDDISQVINHLGYCFVGSHSPNVDDVGYFPLGAAKSCEDMGCIEFYV